MYVYIFVNIKNVPLTDKAKWLAYNISLNNYLIH